MNLERAKGTRDFLPKEKILREHVVSVLKQTFEKYGYSPLETPAIERWDVMTAKFGAGANSDIMDETFSFSDRGKRKLGLRYELTFPLARVMAMNPTMKLPFKRYQIGRVWRDGPIKLGRYREFWQCDADVIGAPQGIADAEMLGIAHDGFKALCLDVTIEVSHRKIISEIMEKVGITASKHADAIIIVDKLKKIGEQNVLSELEKIGIKGDKGSALMQYLVIEGDNFTKLEQLENLLGKTEGISEMRELFEDLAVLGVDVTFNPALARGLGYYTGTIYEVFLVDSEVTSSVAGGGRWDNMIGSYMGRKEVVPAIGLSFGLEPITEALRDASASSTVTQVYVIPIHTKHDCMKIVQQLRAAGVKVDMDLVGKGISKNLQYCNAYGIPYAVIAGEDELASGKVKVRDLKSGKEKDVTLKSLVKEFSKK